MQLRGSRDRDVAGEDGRSGLEKFSGLGRRCTPSEMLLASLGPKISWFVVVVVVVAVAVAVAVAATYAQIQPAFTWVTRLHQTLQT